MSSEEQQQPDPIYLDLATGSEDASVTQIETVCMNCMEKGTTRMLLTLIPHFREVMISSFSCPHCGNSNSGLLNTGAVQDKGAKLTLAVRTLADLRRMIVKSDYASIKIPEVELEVPGRGEMGEVTSVEGVINKVCEGLRLDQERRREDNPDLAAQIEQFIEKLTGLLQVTEPFTLELNDPTGNSFIERLGANGFTDSQVTRKEYERPDKLNQMLGLSAQPEQDNKRSLDELKEEDEQETDADGSNSNNAKKNLTDSTCCPDNRPEEQQAAAVPATNAQTVSSVQSSEGNVDDDEEEEDLHQKVMQFSTLCERCHRPADTNMKLTEIPHFKEVVIMATVCDHCGNKTCEVKSGGGIAPHGRKITLQLDEVPVDMARDVLKSETCSVEIPALDLHVGAGVIGGKFTTLEGLLVNIKDDISSNPFFVGDSVDADRKEKVDHLLQSLTKMIEGELKTSIILDDPAGNSYLQNVYAPDPDPHMNVDEYERTFEQNDDLGLNDMKTEGYEQDA